MIEHLPSTDIASISWNLVCWKKHDFVLLLTINELWDNFENWIVMELIKEWQDFFGNKSYFDNKHKMYKKEVPL